jgi:hypothetical protein
MHDRGGRRTPARPPRRWRRLYLAGLVGALALPLGVAACGGGAKTGGVASLGGTDQPTSTTSAGGGDERQKALNWARCMRQHGTNTPDPRFDANGRVVWMAAPPAGGGAAKLKYRAAEQACKQYETSGGPPPHPPSAQERQQALAFARCMRQHGINMPDPKPGGGIDMRGVDSDIPKFQAAQQACQQHGTNGGKKQEQSSGGGK